VEGRGGEERGNGSSREKQVGKGKGKGKEKKESFLLPPRSTDPAYGPGNSTK